MKKLIILTGIVLMNTPVFANELQLRESQDHLKYIAQKRQEARMEFLAAKKAYNAIDGAYDAQRSVVKGLTKALKRKREAERKAVEAERLAASINPYLRDKDHASGGISDYHLGGTY